MKRLLLGCAFLAAILAATPVAAQNYSFEIPKMEFGVTVNPDASAQLHYNIHLHCNEGAKPIDIVDIGLPHADYDISNMAATLNDQRLTSIRPSEVVDIGVEMPLTPPIQPGETGVLSFNCTMPNMVYQDTTRGDYASMQITPTWFDGDLLTGTTELAILVYLPKSLKQEEILHQGINFTAKLNLDKHKAVGWYDEDARMDGPHEVGVSFPKRVMDRVVKITLWGLAWKWWTESEGARTIVGIISLILFGIFFYRLSGGTGTCLFLPAVIFLIFLWMSSPVLQALFLPVLAPVWYLSEKHLKKMRGKYLPPIASVPGAGIKRGLAVPEAAVLLELPLGKVLALVIFGMLKKDLAVMTNDDPLTVELLEGYDVESRKERRKLAREQGSVIRSFEQDFIEVLRASPATPVAELDFSDAMQNLIDSTAKRLKGFDVEQTKEYYRSIISDAWSEAQEIGEIERREEFVEKNDLWMIMHPQSDYYFDTWHHHGYQHRPGWSLPTGSGAPSTAPGAETSLSDVSASFAGWFENITGNVADTMDPVSLGADQAVAGIDLSGVDQVGVDILSSMAEGSGGGGGGGGCACACAGCACACACAGGGR